MISKERLENVLHCFLTEDNVAYIGEYYRTFYESPESYINDYLVDIIIDDMQLKKIEPWVNDMDAWQAIEEFTPVDIKHISDDQSLAWGHINHVPVYMRRIEGDLVNQFVDMNANFSHDLLQSVADNGADNCTVTRIVKSQNNQLIAYCFDKDSVHKVSDVEQWAPTGWTHIGDFEIAGSSDNSGFGDATMLLYTPFYEMSNGSLLPIMWINTLGGTTEEGSFVLDEFTNINRYDNEVCKSIYAKLREILPPVDLEDESESRYKKIRAYPYTLVYNRNHIAHNGNVKNAKAVSPFIVAMLQKYNGANHKSNVQDLISGRLTDWDEILVENGSSNVSENDDKPWHISATESTRRPNPDNMKVAVVGVGRSRAMASGTTLEKLLQVASDDFVDDEDENR